MPKATLIAPITNVRCSAPVDLGDNTEIHIYHTGLDNVVEDARKKGVVRHPTKYSHSLIVRNADVEKEDRSDAKERLEEAVLRLRLYKPGSIGFHFAIIDRDGWYDRLIALTATQKTMDVAYELIGIFFYIVWDRPGLPSTYDINSEDIAALRSLFALAADQRLMDRQPFRYFFRAYHEPYATDRFLSNAIGLENLLVNDTSDLSNLTYKFVDRGCFLLSQASPHPDGPEGYVSSLTDIYRARNRAVHSTKRPKEDWDSPQDIAVLKASEDHLRTLLQYVLHHPEMEDSQVVDQAKRKRYV